MVAPTAAFYPLPTFLARVIPHYPWSIEIVGYVLIGIGGRMAGRSQAKGNNRTPPFSAVNNAGADRSGRGRCLFLR